MAILREQPLPSDLVGREDASEVPCGVVIDGGLSAMFSHAFAKPQMWGLLRVDIARHAAGADTRRDRFDAEIACPTDKGPTTLRPGH